MAKPPLAMETVVVICWECATPWRLFSFGPPASSRPHDREPAGSRRSGRHERHGVARSRRRPSEPDGGAVAAAFGGGEVGAALGEAPDDLAGAEVEARPLG